MGLMTDSARRHEGWKGTKGTGLARGGIFGWVLGARRGLGVVL